MSSKLNRNRRYNVTLSDTTCEELQELAASKDTSVVELIRRFVQLGILASELQEKPDSALIIREGCQERQVLFL